MFSYWRGWVVWMINNKEFGVVIVKFWCLKTNEYLPTNPHSEESIREDSADHWSVKPCGWGASERN